MTIQTISANDRAIASREFQAQRIRESAEISNAKWKEKEAKKREEILNRLIELSKAFHDGKVGWIREDAIDRDSMLVLNEVLKVFGSIKRAKEATYEAMYGSRYSSPPVIKSTEDSPKETKSDEVIKGNLKRKKPARKKTTDELWTEVRNKSKKLGHVVGASEISEDEEMSSEPTYRKFLGAGWRVALATELGLPVLGTRDKALIMAKDSAAKEKLTTKKEEKTSETNSCEIPVNSLKKTDTEEGADALVVTESSNEVEIPIKVIVPKGIKGTVHLIVEF